MGDERLTDVELAQSIVDAVQDNPKRAKKSARELVNRTDLDPETAAVSWWALGLAARQLNELADAEEAFRIALNIATDAGLARRIAVQG
jgi:cytochrome c-type biogenesis protein CcmH/NrfG